MTDRVTVIGGGLAGSETSLQLARRGIGVRLVEMRPVVKSPAHRTPYLAELVCSNSLKSDDAETSSGLLKHELRLLGCRLLAAAERTRVPAGHALAVDRELFAKEVSGEIDREPLISLERNEQRDLALGSVAVVATGPLTSDALGASIALLFSREHLFFYDAISISVDAETIDRRRTFDGSRYGKGGLDYVNAPMTREEYAALVDFLTGAPCAQRRDFESERCFEACLPVEVAASRGRDALRFGPLKPKGLVDPRTGVEPYAVVQMRREKADGSLLGLVGFQTRLTRPAHKKLLGLIPGLGGAEIVRWGAVHRNMYLDSPRLLDGRQMALSREGLFFSGQIVGVEGYVESIAHGLVTALNVERYLRGGSMGLFPPETMIGALQRHLVDARGDFQPMNANFGLLPAVGGKRRERRRSYVDRAIDSMRSFMVEQELGRV